jgi:hypothetical protein
MSQAYWKDTLKYHEENKRPVLGATGISGYCIKEGSYDVGICVSRKRRKKRKNMKGYQQKEKKIILKKMMKQMRMTRGVKEKLIK